MEWKYSVDTSSDVQGEIVCQLFHQVSQTPNPPGVGDVPGEREEWLPLPGVLHRAGPHPHLPHPLNHLPPHLSQVRTRNIYTIKLVVILVMPMS